MNVNSQDSVDLIPRFGADRCPLMAVAVSQSDCVTIANAIATIGDRELWDQILAGGLF